MKIRIPSIPEQGLSVSREVPVEVFPVLAEIVRSGECRFLAPIRMQLTVIRVDDIIEVTGRLQSRLGLSCSRCLTEFENELSADITLTYAPGTAPDSSAAGDTIEITAQQAELSLYLGDEIDLTEGIQEHLVLALPAQPLCRKDCKGICAGCGADLNHAPCRCEPRIDSRFAVLKNLKIP